MKTYFYVLGPKRVGVGGFSFPHEARNAAAEAISASKEHVSAEVFSIEDSKIVLLFSGCQEHRVIWKAEHIE